MKPFQGKDGPLESSPTRGKDSEKPSNIDLYDIAHHFYKHCTQKATKELMDFLFNVFPEKSISIMYFDQSQELGSLYWVLFHLIWHQSSYIKMWYTFMRTKSRITHYVPPPGNSQCFHFALLACTCLTEAIVHSVLLKEEISPPYFDLGFDQRVIAKSRAVSICMGDMEPIEFSSQYGRPMYVDLAGKPQLLLILLPPNL